MTTNDATPREAERAALVEKYRFEGKTYSARRALQDAVDDAMKRMFFDDEGDYVVTVHKVADRAVPEPDADAVYELATKIATAWGHTDAFDDKGPAFDSNVFIGIRRRAFKAAEIALPTVQAAAGDDLDAMLRHLTDDDLPGKTLSIYRHDGQWGAQQHITHLEEQYPTDVCGHGDGVLEAIADAVAKAKEKE